MFLYILANLIYRQVICILTKRIFYLLGNELQTGQYIQNERHNRNHKITQAKHPADRQRNYINKDELLYKGTVRIRNRCFLYALTTTTDIGKLLHIPVEYDQLFLADRTVRLQFKNLCRDTRRHLVGNVLSAIYFDQQAVFSKILPLPEMLLQCKGILRDGVIEKLQMIITQFQRLDFNGEVTANIGQ